MTSRRNGIVGAAVMLATGLSTQMSAFGAARPTNLTYANAVKGMQLAIDRCNINEYKRYLGEYSTFVRYDSRHNPDIIVEPAPVYPDPCSRRLRTTNIRTPPATEPVKLNQVGTPRKRAEPTPDPYGTAPQGGAVSSFYYGSAFTGFYIGGNVSGNFNTLGQTETSKATDAVTGRFEDSSNKVGFGFDGGYLVAPWNNNFRVGLFGSVDVPNQDTSHTFFGGFFLGQTINTIVTVGGQVGFVPRPNVLLYGQVGAAFVNVTQNLNFLGPVTSVDQTVTGANLGVGVAFQPPDWQFAGNQVALVAQYNRIFLSVATFNNPGSPAFIYDNRNEINTFTAGIRVQFNYATSFRWYN